MFTMSSFKSIKNEHDVYKKKDRRRNVYEFLRKDAMKKIYFKKKKRSY